MESISVVGMGYVGLTLAVTLAKVGFTVHGIENNPDILKTIRAKKSHFYEPGLDDLLQQLVGRRLFFHDKAPSDVSFGVHIISVGTPLKSDGKPNLGHLVAAMHGLKPCYSGNELVVLRSTVSVGVSRNIVCPLLQEFSGRPIDGIRVAFCPERTVEGKALEELTSLPQIISGLNAESLERAETLFRAITHSVVRVESLEAGELIKLFNNTYRDIQFSIGNCFNMISQSFGINGIDVIKAANLGYARSNIALPGFVGGPCLEKDPYILVSSYKETHTNEEIDYVIGARKYNESLVDGVIEWFHRHKKDFSSKTLAVSGLAFKGQPETSDLRGSTAIPILKSLKKQGFKLRLHDFCVSEADMKALRVGEVFSDLTKACKDAGGLIILNNNQNYKKLNYANILRSLKKKGAFFDAWQITGFQPDPGTVLYANFGNFRLR